MNESELGTAGKKKLLAAARKSISASRESMIHVGPLCGERRFPLAVWPAIDGLDPIAWISDDRSFVEQCLLECGAVLLRGFDLRNADQFERLIEASSGQALEYTERSSPRTQVSGRIYTSTDYPEDQNIYLHNENSYQSTWPMKIFFFCLAPATTGGETPIADCRRVFKLIDPKIKQRFIQKKVMYLRNYGNGFGLSWQTVFQTTQRHVVETSCRKAGIEFEWKENGQLRTRVVRPALALHPRLNEMIWFNHATFFHISTREPRLRDELLAAFKEEDLPTNSYYGDGSPIEPSALDEIREIYRQETMQFTWEKGDVLILDNMLSAHGRGAFSGPRQVLVGMSEPYSRKED